MTQPQIAKHEKALVILSGGQDSTTALFWAKRHFQEVHAVTFDYGQTHCEEITAAQRVACLADVATHHFVKLGPILESTSPLTNPQQPMEQYNSFEGMQEIIGARVEKTFVPMRNALFLVLAANRAVATGCGAIVTGICQADGANYPDCTRYFINAAQMMVSEAIGQRGCDDDEKVKILSPFLDMPKWTSVHFALGVPGCFVALAFTHTAYDGKYPPTGKDHANVLRARGFEEAGMPDPLVVRAVMEGLMGLPNTKNYGDAVQINIIARDIRKAKLKLGLDVDNGTTLGLPE